MFVFNYANAVLFDFHQEYKDICKNISNCQEKLKLIGYSFYLSADDIEAKNIIHPFYHKVFKLIEPAGILISLKNNQTIEVQQKNLKELIQDRVTFIGGDNCQAYYNNLNIRFLPFESHTGCHTKLTAVLAKVSGCNFLFNPVVERSIPESYMSNYDKKLIEKVKTQSEIYLKSGLFTTLKHFPFTPQNFDIHKDLVDFKVPYLQLMSQHFPTFKEFDKHVGPVMTTHVFNTLIDQNMITFSKIWIDILKNDLKFKDNLIITDSISMFNSYPKEVVNIGSQYDWLKDFNQPAAIFIRAKLAGHDLIINREAIPFQMYIIKDALKALSGKYPISSDFEKSLLVTKEKVLKFKDKYKDQLALAKMMNQNDFNYLVYGLTQFKETSSKNFCEDPRAAKLLNEYLKF